jgi:glycosyltransferase involved in cell wall biosynthesis
LRIGIFTKSLSKGGAEKQSVILASYLSDYHTVYLITLFDNSYQDYLDKINNSRVIHYSLKGNFFGKIIELVKFLKNEKIEILFCYLVSTNLIGVITGRLAKVKIIIGGIRNSYHPIIKEFFLKLIHNHFTDYSISNNFHSSEILAKKKFNPEKLIVIPNGIELVDAPLKSVNSKYITILTVARFVPQKDYFTAIYAIKYLTAKNFLDGSTKIRYLIVGYGELEYKLKQYIKTKSMSNSIYFENDSKLEELYQQADIYLCTSLYEGTSNSILEAMNYSLPIIATNVGDNSYLVQDFQNGFLCKPKDYKQIAHLLAELSNNASQRRKMGQKSRKMVENNYSMQVFGERYLAFIKDLDLNVVKNERKQEAFIKT